jgi:hypothetical protein
VSRFELRWIRRHPLQWARLVWWHWTITALLLAKAALVTDQLWGITLGATFWPILLGGAAIAVALSAVAPLDERLQQAVTHILLFVSVTRASTYLGLALTVGGGTRLVAAGFAVHWAMFTLVAVRWAALSRLAGAQIATEAARDDRGRA